MNVLQASGSGVGGQPVGNNADIAGLVKALSGWSVQPGVPTKQHGLAGNWMFPHGSTQINAPSPIGGSGIPFHATPGTSTNPVTSTGGSPVTPQTPVLPPVPQYPITGPSEPVPKLPAGGGKTPIAAPTAANVNPIPGVYGVNSGRLPPVESTTYTPSPMQSWVDPQGHENRSQNLDIEARFGPLDAKSPPQEGESFMQYAQRLGFPAQYLGAAALMQGGQASDDSWYETLKSFY